MRIRNRREARMREAATLAVIESEARAPTLEWTALRPLLDEAMSCLRERDRTAVVLRYFEDRSYAEIGAALGLSENAARMRTDRALERLREFLGRRGLHSGAAAIAGLIAGHAVCAAPAGLAPSIAATIAALPVPAGLFSLFTPNPMSSLGTLLSSATVSAAIAASVVWFLPKPETREINLVSRENQRLRLLLTRQETELARLRTAVTARRAAAGTPSGTAEAAPARAATPDGTAPGSRGALDYRNLGQATAYNAYQTFAWASDRCDVSALARLITFDPNDRARAHAALEAMPPNIREQCHTPEELYAFLIAADALRYPPPAADVLAQARAFPLAEGRVAMRLPGSTRNRFVYQQTPDGWKYVFPSEAVEWFPRQFTLRSGAQ